jgi:hypothetical protein
MRGLKKPDGFTPYAAGMKRYGPLGRTAPNVGHPDISGYKERDRRIRARKQALLELMQNQQVNNFNSPGALRPKARKVL